MTDPTSPRALLSVSAIFFVNGAVYGSWAPRLPEVRDRVDVSLAELGLVLSGAAVFAVLATLVAGRIVDRVGSRRAVVASGLVVVAALAGIGAARDAIILVVCLAVVSAGDVVQDIAMNVQATTVSDRRAKPVISRLHGLWSLGTVSGGLAASGMASAGVALDTHLLVAAGLLAATTVSVAPGLLAVDPGRNGPVAEPTAGGVLSRPGVVLAVMGFLAIAMEHIPADWSALRLVEDLNTSPSAAGLAFAAFSAGMLGGRFMGDSVVSRRGERAVLTWGSMVAAAGIAAGMLLPEAVIATLAFGIAGLGVAPVFPLIYAESARMPGLGAGSGIAAMMTGQRFGGLALPVIVGVLSDTAALDVGEAAALVAIPAVVALVVIVRLRGSSFNEA